MSKLQRPPGNSPPPIYFDFTPDLLAWFPLEELASALQSARETIVVEWINEIRAAVEGANHLPFDEIADNVPAILDAMAKALGSSDVSVRRELLVRSPLQGITRFQQHYSACDLMVEDRLLRRLVYQRTEDFLGRRMTLVEHSSLGMGLDLMSQQAVVAFVDYQGQQLRSAAEAELRYLSFLSHDLKNNLGSATVWLQVLKTQIQPHPGLSTAVDTIDTVQQAILTTVGGMGRLLQADKLRHMGRREDLRRIELRTLITNQTRQLVDQAERRGLSIQVDVPADAAVVTDPELTALVMQNLIGNAVKFASPGTVTIRAEEQAVAGANSAWVLSVSDVGPGIPAEHVGRIFKAFQQGTMQGEEGVGLGLAIASRAAALLGGTLTVKSEVGKGSTFELALPSA